MFLNNPERSIEDECFWAKGGEGVCLPFHAESPARRIN